MTDNKHTDPQPIHLRTMQAFIFHFFSLEYYLVFPHIITFFLVSKLNT